MLRTRCRHSCVKFAVRGRFAKNTILATCLSCSRILNSRGLPDYFWEDDERRFTRRRRWMDVGSVASSNFVTSALPVPRGLSLLRKGEISSEALEKEQARLEAAFDALEQQIRTNAVEQRARTDALEQKIRTAALERQIRMTQFKIILLMRRLSSATSRISLITFFLKFHLTRGRPTLF